MNKLALFTKKGFKELKRVGDAAELIIRLCGSKDLGSEKISIKDAWGRVLAEDVVSKSDVPPFHRSAVDGFAVRSHETFSASPSNPAFFKLKGKIVTGLDTGEVNEGECYEIYTGAPIPSGADAVVMLEDCELAEGYVKVKKAVPKFANVSLRGEDITTGDVIIKKGEFLRGWHIGVLASVGESEVTVRRRPRVGIFSTGDELIDIESKEAVPKGMIIDSTRPMIVGLLKEIGCDVLDRGIIRDDFDLILKEMRRLSESGDLIITIGGTSMGGKDLIPEVVSSQFHMIFHGLAVKPGKPAGFAMVGDTPLIMLPGYPVSALIGFEVLALPLLYTWLGRRRPKRERVRAVLTRRIATTPGIRHFLRVMLYRRDGQLFADPITITGSGLLSSITKADGLVIITEEMEGLEEGEEVEVELLKEDVLDEKNIP